MDDMTPRRRSAHEADLTHFPPPPAARDAATQGVRAVVRRVETPHPKLNGLAGTSSPAPAAPNTYEFLARLGKRVVNPGGVRGRDLLLAALNPRPGSRVLEIGCGTGHTAVHLARRWRCQVHAVDIAPEMVEATRRAAQAAGVAARIYAGVADVTQLPFADGHYDYVLCQAVLMFVDKARALAEILRVLKPGGRFGGIEFSWHRTPSAALRQETDRECGCEVLEFHAPAEWRRWLQQAGFEAAQAAEQPFTLLSPAGFLRDEGLANSLRLLARLAVDRAARRRLREIWGHFARHRQYFSYVVLTGRRPAAPAAARAR